METSTVKRYLPWVVATALFMEQLDTTIVSTAVPAMAQGLGVTPLSLKAVVASYILSLAVCIPVSGWLADRFGTRKVFAIAVAGFTVSSILCGLAMNVPMLVAARLLNDGAWEDELRQTTKDGKQIIVASRWTRVCDESGRPKSQMTINTDMTEKKKLEARLIQAQRMEAVGRLAGGVAHDFNNLLTVIIGFSEMVLGGLSRDEPTREMIQQVHLAGTRAASLTRQLLAFSRKQVLAPVVLDLNSLVSETEKMLCRMIGEDIALVAVLDPSLGRVKADPGQIEQVLMNLAVNARDAMPTGGRLTIATQNVEVDPSVGVAFKEMAAGPYVLLTVSDTGCGMDEATMAQIFEPFFTTKEVDKGTGLGLATVYGIMKQSDGAIDVTSAPGQGSAFKIYLPRLVQETAKAGGAFLGIPAIPQGTGMVLMVEDEQAVRSLSSLALRSAGYAVLEAENGEDALAVYRKHSGSIDLLAIDVVMPKMNGRQLADDLTSKQPGLKVLYMSGYTDDAVVLHGVKDAGLAFLQKPFTPYSLVRKVREVLGH